MTISITMEQGDALKKECDILILKFIPRDYGLDSEVASRLEKQDQPSALSFPSLNEWLFIKSDGCVSAKSILFIGVDKLSGFEYHQIREFSRKSFEIIKSRAPDTKKIVLTPQGAKFGLDEREAFESELAGVFEAIACGQYPDLLEEISIVEIDPDRAKRLSKVLAEIFPKNIISLDDKGNPENITKMAAEKLRPAGYASRDKPFAFVAMPYDDSMDDIFHYGIRGAVDKTGFLCERVDTTSFTGDIVERMKRRICESRLVIADLTSANPNVYLEVGYAWGIGKPTILLAQNASDLKFDVKNQKCLVYKKIKDLELLLHAELNNLLSTA